MQCILRIMRVYSGVRQNQVVLKFVSKSDLKERVQIIPFLTRQTGNEPEHPGNPGVPVLVIPGELWL
jgi:hypothetical protein